MQLWRGSYTSLLLFRLVDSKRRRPVLSKNWPASGAQVFCVQDIKSTSKTITNEQVVEMFPNNF